MFETIAILFIFFIIVLFGFIFYTRIQKTTYKAEQEEAVILRAIQIAEKASFLPEIQCSFDNVPVEDCIDKYKLEALTPIIDPNKIYYYRIFGDSRITINQTYPSDTVSWTLYDRPKEGERLSTQIPVSIYNPATDQYTFGVIYVEVYR